MGWTAWPHIQQVMGTSAGSWHRYLPVPSHQILLMAEMVRQSPLIHGEYIPRPPADAETADSTEP